MSDPSRSPDRLKAIEQALRASWEALLPHMAKLFATHTAAQTPKKERAPCEAPSFTDRQREYIYLACQPEDHTRAQVADYMDISVHGVDKICREVHRKLGVQSKVEMLHKARELGLLEE